MGNCLSPVCSNLYMEFFEKYLLRTILPDDVIWYRYVDDVFCLWPENLVNFLCQLNNLLPSIEFSIEEEIDFKIPFLDVMIERVEHNFNSQFTGNQQTFVLISTIILVTHYLLNLLHFLVCI